MQLGYGLEEFVVHLHFQQKQLYFEFSYHAEYEFECQDWKFWDALPYFSPMCISPLKIIVFQYIKLQHITRKT